MWKENLFLIKKSNVFIVYQGKGIEEEKIIELETKREKKRENIFTWEVGQEERQQNLSFLYKDFVECTLI